MPGRILQPGQPDTIDDFCSDLPFQPNSLGAYCARCGSCLVLCQCRGLEHGKDVVFAVCEAPNFSELSRQQNFRRWAQFVTFHPAARRFNARQFYDDFMGKGYLNILSRSGPKLLTMMDSYKQDQLHNLVQQLGMELPELRERCDKALVKFMDCQLSRMASLDLVLIRNAFRFSDPIRFPTADEDLVAVFDVVNCALKASELAFTNIAFSFED